MCPNTIAGDPRLMVGGHSVRRIRTGSLRSLRLPRQAHRADDGSAVGTRAEHEFALEPLCQGLFQTHRFGETPQPRFVQLVHFDIL